MTNELKLHLYEQELAFYGFSVSEDRVNILDHGFSEPINIFYSRIENIKKENINYLKEEWSRVCENVNPIAGGINVSFLRVLQKSINRLYKKSFHEVFKNTKISSHINNLSSICADRMSAATAEQAAVAVSRIEIYEYNIKKIEYIKYLIKIINNHKMQKSASIGVDINSSIQGPYSNLDLPMQERVFEWKDIDEETMARQESKQKQKRYTMGLEDMSSSEPKVGYYWRELRNDPYPFPYGEDEANYPYRKVLWGNP